MVSLKEMGKKLRDVFTSLAKKPTPEEKALQARYKQFKKHVLKNHFGLKVWRGLRNTVIGLFTAAASISTATEVFPGLATQSFGDYMKEKGYGENLDDYYRNKDIRVWRNDWIMPFKFAGMVTREEIRQIGLQKDGLSYVANMLWEPVRYSITLKDMIKRVNQYPDAYPFTQNVGQMLGNDETSYIRTGGKNFTMDLMLRSTLPGNFSLITFNYKSDPVALDSMFQKYVMLHEARHADQNLFTISNMDETDADQFAFAVLESENANPDMLAELKRIVLTIRALGGVAGGDHFHYSSEFNDTPRSILQGIEDASGAEQFARVLRVVSANNTHVFEDSVDAFNRVYSNALRIYMDPLCQENRPMRTAAEAFLAACNHVNELQGGTALNVDFRTVSRISLYGLHMPYSPNFDYRFDPAEKSTSKRPPRIEPAPVVAGQDTAATTEIDTLQKAEPKSADTLTPRRDSLAAPADTAATKIARSTFLRTPQH